MISKYLKVLPLFCSISASTLANAGPDLFEVSPFAKNKGVSEDVSEKVSRKISMIKGKKNVKKAQSVKIKKRLIDEIILDDYFTLNIDGQLISIKIKDVHREENGKSRFHGSNSEAKAYVQMVKNKDKYMGTIKIGNSLYKVKPFEDGHIVIQMDNANMSDHDDEYAEPPFQPQNDNGSSALMDNSSDEQYPESSEEIFIVVAYTEGFEADSGDIETYMDLLEAETNLAFTNSDVSTSVRIVHSYLTGHEETGSFANDLQSLTDWDNDDGDTLRALRIQYSADLMILLVGNDAGYDSGCGRAQGIGVTQVNAMAVAKESCATGYYSFAHEIGHLAGARHIISQDDSTTPFAYGHGYCNTTSDTFRTVMAYSCPEDEGGPRIQQWSNPDVQVDGDDTGTEDDEDNARVWDNQAKVLANFRVGMPGASEVNDYFGAAVASGDFNGDGFDDIVVGVPRESIVNDNNPQIIQGGAVNIVYGSAGAITPRDSQIFYQDYLEIEGGSEAYDWFGFSVTSGDFNGDGFDDIAVGVPGESIGSIDNAGLVNIIYGSSDGLTNEGDQVFFQDSPGIEGGSEANDLFGSSVSAGDFNGDGYSDLVIGVPGEAIGSIDNAGSVNIIYGSINGLTSAGDQSFYQNFGSIEGGSEANDLFGSSVSTGDFNNDGYSDLIVGVPGEAIGSIDNAGSVNIIYGSNGGLTDSGNQSFYQNFGSIEGGSEANDLFGASVTSGDYNGDGFFDVGVGVPGEAIGTIDNAGLVNIIYGSINGLTDVGDQVFYQNFGNIEGGSEQDDLFGASVSSGDFNGDGISDIVIGVPGESIGAIDDAGAVNIIFGSIQGLSDSNDQIYFQDVGSVEGGSEAGDLFGSSVAAGDLNGDNIVDLIVGVPGESIWSFQSDKSDGGMINVLYGSSNGITDSDNKSLHQDTPLPYKP